MISSKIPKEAMKELTNRNYHNKMNKNKNKSKQILAKWFQNYNWKALRVNKMNKNCRYKVK